MSTSLTLSASDFKATCLDLMDRARDGSIDAITITKRGKPHVTIRFASADQPAVDPFGCMKGTTGFAEADFADLEAALEQMGQEQAALIGASLAQYD
ncbi:MAG: type II toxin-antitoxin system prevent-host-death family antitoxin [Sphingomonadales bacterium]|jgi:prevent-host-death family protein